MFRFIMLMLAPLLAIAKVAEKDIRQGTMSVNLSKVVPSGRPIIFELTILDTGQKPFYYWCVGPGLYPGTQVFQAESKSATGQTCESQLTNGQYSQGSGHDRAVEPGTTIILPAAMEPLPVGDWQVSVKGDQDGYLRDGTAVITWPGLHSETIDSLSVRDYRFSLLLRVITI